MKITMSLFTLIMLLMCGTPTHAQSINENQATITSGALSHVSIVSNRQSTFAFSANADETASILLTNSTYDFKNCPLCTTPSISIVGPNGRLTGTELSESATSSHGQFMNAVQLPVSGNYQVVFAPQHNGSGSVDATLFLFSNDFEMISPNVPETVKIKYPGQKALLSFQGLEGQTVSFILRNSTFGSCHSCNSLTARVAPIVGPALIWTKISGGNVEASTTSATLPATGRYTLTIDPQGSRTGSIDVQLTLN